MFSRKSDDFKRNCVHLGVYCITERPRCKERHKYQLTGITDALLHWKTHLLVSDPQKLFPESGTIIQH